MSTFIKRAFLLLAVIGVVCFLSSRVLFFKKGFLEYGAACCLSPLITMSGSLATYTRGLIEQVHDYRVWRVKYEQLHAEYMIMLDELIKERATSRAYAQITPLIEFEQRYDKDKAIIAKILVKNLTPEEHYFLINRGLRDGIHKDMVAFYHNHLVGRIVDVYDGYSKMQLITDQHCKVAVYTATSRASGIVQGFNCVNRCNVSYVSHLMKVNDHDLVISSGQGLVFPEGFCVGKIVLNTLQEKSLYHEIQIQPMINIETLRYCFIAHAGDAKML